MFKMTFHSDEPLIKDQAAQASSASWPRYLSIKRLWYPSGPSDVETFAVKKPPQLKISAVIPVKKITAREN